MKLVRIAILGALLAVSQVIIPGAAHAATQLTFSPNPVASGQQLTVYATGLSPGTYYAKTTLPGSATSTITTASGGNAQFTITVPSSTSAGQYQASVDDSSTGSPAAGPANFQVSGGQLSVTPNPAAPGANLTVNGQFLPPSTPVNVSVVSSTGTQVAGGFTDTTTAGTFQTTFTLPSSVSAGTYTVYAKNQAGDTLAQTTLTVSQSSASITLNPTSVTAGANAYTVVAGTGFGQTETVKISYTYNPIGGTSSTVEQQSASTSTSGTFSMNLPVPANVPGGVYVITATGQSSNLTATANLTVNPSTPATITLTPPFAQPGTLITVAGAHFNATGTITITANFPSTNGLSVPVSTNATPGSDGTFTAQFSVPAQASSGNVTVTASQPENGATLTATAQLSITALQPTLVASPTSVAAGGAVQISGQGFAPGLPVNISVTGAGASNGTAIATANGVGSFTVTINIASTAISGTDTISAVQTNGVTATTTVFVTGVPTSTPTATPTNTPTSTPTPTATPIPHHFSYNLRFGYASLWYHPVPEGTVDHLQVRANHRTRLGIWVHVLFPNGKHLQWYTHTNRNGFWARNFNVPNNALSPFSDHGIVTFQLWHHKTTIHYFILFTVVRHF